MTRNLIGGHDIDHKNWVLSLVRKFGHEHAYLILEGIEAEEGVDVRVMKEVHLVIMKGTNPSKAQILPPRDMTIEKLIEVGNGCSFMSWEITKTRADAFLKLVEAETSREIRYFLPGRPRLAGICASSAPAETSRMIDESKEGSSASVYAGYSAEMLLRGDGHNCYSWAEAMVLAMQLPMRNSWSNFLVQRPSNELPGPEQSTSCRVM